MPAVFTSRSLDAASGYFYYLKKVGTTDTSVSVTLPTNVATRLPRPWWAYFKRRIFVAGMFSKPLIFAENYRLYTVGITAPTTAPTIAAGAGTGLTGDYIGYYTFAHYIDSTLVHESAPSPGSASVTLANQDRSWTGIPATAPDPRVNAIHLYVSVAGGTAKFVAKLSLGTTATVENVGDDSLLEESSNKRGVPPYSLFMEPYHRRMFYVDPAHPERLYFSELDEPESVYSLSWFSTQGAEHITGIKVVRGQLIVFTRNATYLVDGYDTEDLSMLKISPTIGCIAPYSILNINEVLYFLSEKGLFTYDGATFRFIMDPLFSFFQTDYLANIGLYADSIGCEDRQHDSYHLLIPKATGFRYVADYGTSAVEANQMPKYSFFKRTRKDYVIGTVRGIMVTGSDDGYLRFENVVSDVTDDDDSYQKLFFFRGRHDYEGDVGWEEAIGKRWIDIDVFMRCEESGWVLRGYAGAETAYGTAGAYPGYTAFVNLSLNQGFVGKSHHHFRPVALSGQGVTLTISAALAASDDLELYGYGLSHIGGANSRPRT